MFIFIAQFHCGFNAVDTYGGGKYTPYVCLGSKRYTEKVDIWSLGCVFGEMLLRHPLLMGRSDMEQITTICNLCGTPTLDNWPDWKLCSPACESLRMEYKAPTIRERFADHPLQAIRFLEMVLALNPLRRPSAEDILMHDYFYTDPLPLQPHEIPHFDRSNELNTKQLRDQQWRRGILD
jgi:serine/threonine protein kinase